MNQRQDEIQLLAVGPELDGLVAEALGWQWWHWQEGAGYYNVLLPPGDEIGLDVERGRVDGGAYSLDPDDAHPPFSGDSAHVWEIEEFMARPENGGWEFKLHRAPALPEGWIWRAHFAREWHRRKGWIEEIAGGATPAEATCKAFLMARCYTEEE